VGRARRDRDDRGRLWQRRYGLHAVAVAKSGRHHTSHDAFPGGARIQAERGSAGDGQRHDHGHHLTVDLQVTGLQAASIHVSHIHIGSCTARGGILRALNPVIADSQGGANTKSTVNLKYPPASGHLYVVVHVGPDMVGTNSKYLLCGNLFK